MSGIQYIFGGGGIRGGRGFGEPDQLTAAYKILEKGGCKKIDTATLYGESQAILGQTGAKDRFVLDTKTKGGFGGKATRETILREAKESKEQLGTNVDVYYIHAPDHETPLDETLGAIDEVYKQGFFKRFGLSNYQAEDVEKVYNHCKEKGYVLPSVYQGESTLTELNTDDSQGVMLTFVRQLQSCCP